MIYKHLGQRRQVAGTESDAGCIRSSGQVEHRIENVTLAQAPDAMQHQGMLCTEYMFGHPPRSRSRLGCVYPDSPETVAQLSWQNAFTGLDPPE